MILPALHQLSLDENLVSDLDYFWRTVPWIIDIRGDGSLIEIIDNRVDINEGKTNRQGKALPRKMVPNQIYCPTQFYRPGKNSPPHFMVDTSRYIFGIDDTITEERRNRLRLMFHDLVAACAMDTKHFAPQAVVKFMELYTPPNAPQFPEEHNEEGMMAFRVRGKMAHHYTPVKKWWANEQAKRDEGDGDYQCFVTGKPFSKINLFPKTGGIPGAGGDTKVVSCDKDAYWSHKWRKNENAPICREAGIHIGAALTRLISGSPVDGEGRSLPRRRLLIPGNTAVCYWAHEPSEQETHILDNLWNLVLGRATDGADEALQCVWDGKSIEIDDPAIVYVLSLSGAKGRATVRDWYETTLPKMLKYLSLHYKDMSIGRNGGDKYEPTIPFARMIESLSTGEGKSPTIPLATELKILTAIFTGGRYPQAIQSHVLRRTKVEASKVLKEKNKIWDRLKRMDARMALLKAYMNRRRRFDVVAEHKYPEVETYVNPAITDSGYLLGAVLALLERIQLAAAGKLLNSTIIDRYFTGASVTPASAFIKLLRGKTHHMTKVRGSNKKLDRITAYRCDRMLTSLLASIDGPIPARLDVDGQSMFVLGYHQMRYFLYMPREKREVWEDLHSDADSSFLWVARGKEIEAEAEAAEASAAGKELVAA